MRDMIKSLLLIFDSAPTWERIAAARHRLFFILLAYLLPFLLLTSAVEGYGLVHWGKPRGEVLHVKKLSLVEAVDYESAQLVLSLVIVFVGAKLVKSLGETFHGRNSFTQAFTVVAYGLGPLYLLRLFDAFPGVSPWITWAIGIILAVAVLYNGVPRIMQPDPPHAFGLYLTSALLLAATTGLARFLTAWYLQGKFPKLDALFPA